MFPIDLANCSREALSLLNSLAQRPDATIILLYVVNLSILAPDTRLYDEVCREAEQRLARLAGATIHAAAALHVRVRLGKPAHEIVAEAREQKADLIVLPIHAGTARKRHFALFVPKIVEHVSRNAPCGVFVLHARTRINGEDEWGGTNPALDLAQAATSIGTDLRLPPTDDFLDAAHPHLVAAQAR